MMRRCKIGDRAAIIGGIRDNVGHLVNVIRPHSTRPGWWVVEVLGQCLGRGGKGPCVLKTGDLGNIRDINLKPLRTIPTLWW